MLRLFGGPSFKKSSNLFTKLTFENKKIFKFKLREHDATTTDEGITTLDQDDISED